MSEGPHYIVEDGTNIRRTLVGKDGRPEIHDTAEIAQKHIGDRVDYRRRAELPTPMKAVPISVAEYDEKYSEPMKSDDSTLRAARDANKTLRVDVADRDEQIDKLTEDNVSLRTAIDDLNSQLTEKRAIINEITRLRVNEVERTEAFKAELSARKEDFKVLMRVDAPESGIIDRGKPEVTPLDHETYVRVISALRTDVDDRDKHIEGVESDNRELRASCGMQMETLKAWESLIGHSIGNTDNLLHISVQQVDTIRSLRTDVDDRDKHIEGLESDIRELRASRGRQTETIRDLMNDLQQKDGVTIQLVERSARRDETIRTMRNTNGALDRNLQDRNVRLGRVRDVIDEPRGRSFQAIVERISDIIREDEP